MIKPQEKTKEELIQLLAESLSALSAMWQQYCPPPWTHMFMSAGEQAEEVLNQYGLLRADETAIDTRYDEDTPKWMIHRPEPSEKEIKKMTELKLYKFVQDCEWEWAEKSPVLWVKYSALPEFMEMVGYNYHCMDGGIAARLQESHAVIEMNNICEYFSIDIEKVFPKIDHPKTESELSALYQNSGFEKSEADRLAKKHFKPPCSGRKRIE
jgi:hypothetical protein